MTERRLTAKQEAFALAYVENGGNASAAYRTAYNTSPDCKPNTVEKRACELVADGKVRGRIDALRAKIAARAEKKVEITVELLTSMTLEAYKLAAGCEKPQASAMVKANEFLGKLHGLVVERRQVTINAVDDLDDRDLADIARSGSNGTVAPANGSPHSH